MERVRIETVESTPFGEQSVRRKLADPLGTAAVSINLYQLGPGEGLPGGLHAHEDQEEVFVVLDGEAIFETLNGEICVNDREAIRFTPGEFQTGRAGQAQTRILAVGAPRDSADVRVPATCPDCGHEDLLLATDGRVTFECPDCGEEHIPADCPACGHARLEFSLDSEREPVVVCNGCEQTYDQPPL